MRTRELTELSALYDAWESADEIGRKAILEGVLSEREPSFVTAFRAMVDATNEDGRDSVGLPALDVGLPHSLREEAIERVRGAATESKRAAPQSGTSKQYDIEERFLSDALSTESVFITNSKGIDAPDADTPFAPFEPFELKSGARVAHYRLIRELGRGGMAVVWLARRADGLHQREVALKMPLRGEGEWLLNNRFARERAILAALEHPNIARLYETGTPDQGQPFLAIEYVDGKPINRFVADGAMKADAIVQLFTKVLEAIVYAHGRLIIHRDIKPSNILVDAKGEPRLLDFGIAKLLDEDIALADATQLTRVSGRAFTLDYASPEQVNSEPLGVSSDVYSLGVVLFELLTGSSAYATPDKPESRRALEERIVSGEIRKASEHLRTLAMGSNISETKKRANALRGELDTIIATAMAKSPKARYSSAQTLLDDLRRYLANEPIRATPDSRWYVFRKFVRRNRVSMAVGGAVFASLALGLAGTLWQAGLANKALAQAESANSDALRSLGRSEAMASVLRRVLSGATGTTSATELLDDAEQVVALKYANDAETRAVLQYELAKIRNARDDRASLKRLLDDSLASADAAQDVGTARAAACALASWRAREGASEGAIAAMDSAINELAARSDLNDSLVECLTRRAGLKRDFGLPQAEVIADARRALELIVPRHSNGASRALLLSLIGTAEQSVGGFHQAIATYSEALSILEATGESDSQTAASVRLGFAGVYDNAGQARKARELLQIPFDRASASGKTMTSAALVSYAGQLRKLGRYEESDRLLATTITNAEQAKSNFLLGSAKLAAARTRCEMSDVERCFKLAQEAAELLTRVLPAHHISHANVNDVLGTAHFLRADFDSASVSLEKALSAFSKQPSHLAGRAVLAHVRLAEVYSAKKDSTQARKHADAAYAFSAKLKEGFERSEWMGHALLAQAKAARAEGDQPAAQRSAQSAAEHFAASIDESAPATKTAAAFAKSLGTDSEKR